MGIPVICYQQQTLENGNLDIGSRWAAFTMGIGRRLAPAGITTACNRGEYSAARPPLLGHAGRDDMAKGLWTVIFHHIVVAERANKYRHSAGTFLLYMHAASQRVFKATFVRAPEENPRRLLCLIFPHSSACIIPLFCDGSISLLLL